MKLFTRSKRIKDSIIVRLLLNEEDAAMSTPDGYSEDQPKRKILFLVEDDEAVGAFLVQVVKDETSYEALLVTNGFQALERLKTLTPDLFVLDYQLPGMNGLELYDQIQTTEGLETVPVIFMSANLPIDELRKRQVSYIEKPFDLEEFLHCIEKLFAE